MRTFVIVFVRQRDADRLVIKFFLCNIHPRMATVVQWTVGDVASWLEQCLQLPYSPEFVQASGLSACCGVMVVSFIVHHSSQAGIDGVQLVHLTRPGLLRLGVESEEHITCLLRPELVS